MTEDVTVNDLVAFFAAFQIWPTTWASAFAVLVVANTLLLYVGPLAR